MNSRSGRWGKWELGRVSADWVNEHPRDMVLTRPLLYVDRHRVRWESHIGEGTNGASVPWFFRRLCPAYIGFYRRASVVYDVACARKGRRYGSEERRPSWQVHRMFYEASRLDIEIMAEEIDNKWQRRLWVCWSVAVAWAMWCGVRVFGPRF